MRLTHAYPKTKNFKLIIRGKVSQTAHLTVYVCLVEPKSYKKEMSVSLFNAVSPRGSAGAPVGAIEVLLDEQNEPWFKRAHVGKFLDIKHIVTSLEGLDDCEQRSRYELKMGSVARTSYPKVQNTDSFLSAYGVMHVVVNSRKSKGKELRDWILRDVVPRGVNKLMEEEHQKAIDEKDMQIALLDDDLVESQDLARQLEFSNTGMQGEIRAKDQQIAHLEQRYVHLLAEEKKNYGMTIIAKNDESAEYPYISICGQHGYRKQKKWVVLLKNPGSTEFTDGDTPNAIVTYNMW